MAKKTNTIINGKNYFRTTATIGKKTDGTLIRKQFYGESKKEAENKRDEYLLQITKGLNVDFDKAIFIDIFDKWFFEIIKNKVSISTFIRYETEYKLRIKNSQISNMKLIDIKSIHIQNYYNELNKSYSTTTIKCINKLLNRFFKYCLKTDAIIKNPVFAIELPINNDNINNEKYKFLSKQDIDKLIKNSSENIETFIYVFAIFSGLRIGEILALTHKDINLEKGIINVNKSVAYLPTGDKSEHVIGKTKTQAGLREVPILSSIQSLFFKHIQNEKEKHLKLGIFFNENNVLFSSINCDYQTYNSVRYRFQKTLKKLNIKETNLHSLRHTFCSLLAEQGISLKSASILMGHSNISITANIYTHINAEEKKKSIESLSILF